jgi:hypothetical protein
MTEARPPFLDEILAPGSYGFLALDLAFKDERDLPGLLRYKLESVLPRGVEGLRYFFRRIPRTRRILVALVKQPVPESFSPSRTALPFVLQIREKDGREIVWVSRNASYLVRYEGGTLASVEVLARGAERDAEARMDAGGALPERREALAYGPSVQQAIGREDLAWKIASAALGLALAAQLAFAAANAVATRSARLGTLEEQISVLSRQAREHASAAAAAPDTGLQSRADEIQASVSRRWISGYFLEKWSLKAGLLRLEGWGPNALNLLASLRGDSVLAKLDLASRKDEEGYEVFAFEGEVGDD